MSTTALMIDLFKGHRIRLSTVPQGEARIVVAKACAALAESPLVWAMTNRRDEEDCLHSEQEPGFGGFTLALINEAPLLRRLLTSDNPNAPRMRCGLTLELLPALQHRHRETGELPQRSIDVIRRQPAAEVHCGADEIIHLTGVSHAEALLSVMEEIQAHSSHAAADRKQPVSQRPAVAWLTTDQVADRLDGTLRQTNQRLATGGWQQRNEDDDWQLTEAGLDWGVALPLCRWGKRRQQIFWNPAVVTLLEGER